MKKFYGRNGIDSVLWAPFAREVTPGFFVEVGALDGVYTSNTYAFEQSGWSGMCIEPHPRYAKLCKKNRPRSITIQVAVSDKNDRKTIPFFANPGGAASTVRIDLARKIANRHKHLSIKQYKKINVVCRTLESLFIEHNVGKVDIISIDTEGTEMDVLRGMNFGKYLPRVVCVERNFTSSEEDLINFMGEHNYYHARQIEIDHVYCREKEDVEIIKNARIIKREDL